MRDDESGTDKSIIDIRRYLGRSPAEGGRVFSIWGGEGERARLALPVWRAIYLLGSERGGIVRVSKARPGTPVPFFVLDLGEEPARTSFPPEALEPLSRRESPSLTATSRGDLAVLLGEEDGQRWYLFVVGVGVPAPVEGKRREDLMFLAGECAGLLFLRDFAKDGG